MADITNNEGQGLDIRPLISGTDVIGVFPSGTFLTVNQEKIATDSSKINAAVQIIMSGTVIGSLIKFYPTGGSSVRVLSYTGAYLSNVGSWV